MEPHPITYSHNYDRRQSIKLVVLMEIGSWQLTRSAMNEASWITHSCEPLRDEEAITYYIQPHHMNSICKYCSENPPKEIQALFLLHNWDEFQGTQE